MSMMIHAALPAVLALSLLGYGALYQRSRLPVCFFPITFVSGVSVCLYGFGFFGLMKIGSYAILLLGLLLLLLLCRKANFKAFLCDPSLWLFAVAAVWLHVITRGAMLSHWDDGSHWYRICKAIYAEGALPTTRDILYYNYVPGCQLFNYFVLRFIDFSIPNLLFAQSMINVSCVVTLFAGMDSAKGKLEKGMCFAAIALAGAVLCSMTLGTYSLVVDLQLGLTAMALLVLLLDQGNKRETLWPAMLVMSFLLLVKNSAVFFAVAVFLWAAYRQRWRAKKLLRATGALLAVPMLLRAAYSVRADMVFAGAAESPQTISFARFGEMLALKDPASILLFVKRYFFKVFIGDSGQSMAVYVSIGLLILVYVCLRMEKKSEAKAVGENLLLGTGMLLAYIVLLFGTYLISMNENEMISVNSFYRYFGSMVIVLAGIAIYSTMSAVVRSGLGQAGVARVLTLGLLVFAVAALPGAYPRRYIWGVGRFNMPDYYGPSFWQTMQYHIPQNRQYSGKQYVVFWDREDFGDSALINMGVAYNIGAWLRSENVVAIERSELRSGLSAEQRQALDTCDQLVFVSDMSADRALLEPMIGSADLTLGMRTR